LDVFEDLTVITYGLRALNLLEGMHVTVYCLGGRLYRNSKAFVGDITEATLQRIQVDKCFFSMSGISEDGIMSDAGEAENILHRMMLKQNAKKICLVDSSKIATRSMFRIGEISDIDYIISDVDIYTLIKKPVDGKIPTFILAQ
jgi:DeoR/GlpR family transcriptional regulator of sugar metabolism